MKETHGGGLGFGVIAGPVQQVAERLSAAVDVAGVDALNLRLNIAAVDAPVVADQIEQAGQVILRSVRAVRASGQRHQPLPSTSPSAGTLQRSAVGPRPHHHVAR